MIGLEVESVTDRGKLLAPFTIASVISAEQHPNADRLRVCMVDTGDGDPVQVVCGAPNARAGMKGVFVPPGAFIPGKNMTLGVGTIRGVESRGMLVSAFELQISDDHEGIIELPDDAPVGANYAAWAGLDDPVIEINLTPNRADCTGVSGIARDLAAAGMGKLRDDPIKPVEGRFPCPVKVTLDFGATPSLCPAFGLRLVRGVKNGPSPDWLQRRLHRDRVAADQRARRHHQFHHLRPRPTAARVRCRKGARQSDRPARARRREPDRARRQALRARRDDLRDRRRARRGVAGRHHGRRGHRLLGDHDRRADRIRAVGTVEHRAERPQARHQFGCALPFRARCRSRLHAAGARARHPHGARSLRRRALRGDRSGHAGRARARDRFSAPRGDSAWPESRSTLPEIKRVLGALGFAVGGRRQRASR